MYAAWRAIRWWMRVLFGVLGGAASAYVVIDASRDHLDYWWYFHGALLLPAAIVLGLGSAFAVLEGVFERMYAEQRDDLARRIDKQLYVLHREMHRKFHPPKDNVPSDTPRASRKTLNRVGLTVWIVPRWFALLDGLPLPHRVRQSVGGRVGSASMWRAAGLRFNDTATPTQIRWQRGRGLIGVAWRSGFLEHLDMGAAWPAKTLAEHDWAHAWSEVPPQYQLGLTAAQARRLRGNYEGALASPIYARRKDGGTTFVGVLAIDLASGTTDLPISTALLHEQSKAASNRIADLFGGK